MLNKMKGNTVAAFLVVVMLLALVGGYIANIVAIAHDASAAVTGLFIVRVVGIFIPVVGAVLGFV